MIAAIALAAVLAASALLTHYEALRLISALTVRIAPRRRAVLVLIVGVLAAHLLEIALYAAGYWAGEHLHLGRLTGHLDAGIEKYFYFSAETFTTLGFGDIVPTGNLRLLAGLEPLIGLLLVAWSGSWTYLLVQRSWEATEPPRR